MYIYIHTHTHTPGFHTVVSVTLYLQNKSVLLCCNMTSNFSDLEHEPEYSASNASDEESDVASLLLTEEQRLAIKLSSAIITEIY